MPLSPAIGISAVKVAEAAMQSCIILTEARIFATDKLFKRLQTWDTESEWSIVERRTSCSIDHWRYI